jgi:hypothetical protein
MGPGKKGVELTSDRQQESSIPVAVIGAALVDRLMCQILQNHIVWPDIHGRGIVIDLRPELANASDSMRINRESFSNEIDERERQFEKHAEQRISILKGIAM